MKLTPQRKKELLIGAGGIGGLLALLYLRNKNAAATTTSAVGPLFDPSSLTGSAGDPSAFTDPYALPPDTLTSITSPTSDPTQPAAAGDTAGTDATVTPTDTAFAPSSSQPSSLTYATYAATSSPVTSTSTKPSSPAAAHNPNDVVLGVVGGRAVVQETTGNVGEIARGDVIAVPPAPQPLDFPTVGPHVSSNVNDTGAGGGQRKPSSGLAKTTRPPVKVQPAIKVGKKVATPISVGAVHRPGVQL